MIVSCNKMKIIMRILSLVIVLVISMAASSFGDDIPLCTSVRSALTNEDWEYIASHYDLVLALFSPNKGLAKENERIKWIKTLNTDLVLLVYGSAINAANFPLPSSGRPREHADWFLRDEAGEFVTDWEYKDALLLDPGNQEWQPREGIFSNRLL